MKTRQPVEPPQIPTPELTAKGEFRLEPTGPQLGAPMRVRRLDSCELDSCLFRNQITEGVHCTLARFAGELRRAGLQFSIRSSAEPASSSSNGMYAGDIAFARTARVRDQMRALSEALSKTDMRILLAMLTNDQPVSKGFAPVLTRAAGILDGLYEEA